MSCTPAGLPAPATCLPAPAAAACRVPWLPSSSTCLASLQDDYEPGNLGFDPLGLKPSTPAARQDMQTRELNNGRLAMLSIIAFWLQELRDPSHTSEWRGAAPASVGLVAGPIHSSKCSARVNATLDLPTRSPTRPPACLPDRPPVRLRPAPLPAVIEQLKLTLSGEEVAMTAADAVKAVQSIP